LTICEAKSSGKIDGISHGSFRGIYSIRFPRQAVPRRKGSRTTDYRLYGPPGAVSEPNIGTDSQGSMRNTCIDIRHECYLSRTVWCTVTGGE